MIGQKEWNFTETYFSIIYFLLISIEYRLVVLLLLAGCSVAVIQNWSVLLSLIYFFTSVNKT